MSRLVNTLLPVLLASSLLVGCASMMNSKDIETERLLSAAGFQMRLATTPDQLAALKERPQQKLVPQNHGGKVIYTYADAKVCKCIFAGTERNFNEYQRLALDRELTIRRQETAADNADAAMDMSSFGPWGPWWY
jgi:hypothetical protein